MPNTAVELEFADGRYRFWLPMPRILELERACGIKDSEGRLHPKSVFQMFDEMGRGLAYDAAGEVQYVDGGASHPLDINETIRLGLIGGESGIVNGEAVKVGPITAKQLVADYAYPATDLGDSLAVAWAVLNAAINGVRLKKKAAAIIAESESDPSPSEKAAS